MLSRPWWDTHAPAEVAHQMALLPLLCVALVRIRRPVDAAWWWIAGAFAVSWLADLADDFLPPHLSWVPVVVYPVTQTALIGAVFLRRSQALVLLGALVVAGIGSALWHGADSPDIILHILAWGAVLMIVGDRPELPHRLRICLAVYFGVGLFAWLVHAMRLDLATWYAYQTVRLAGLSLFCWATLKPGPSLRIAV